MVSVIKPSQHPGNILFEDKEQYLRHAGERCLSEVKIHHLQS